MSEDIQQPVTIEYESPDISSGSVVRPLALLLPNIAAAVIIFLPILAGDSPASMLTGFAMDIMNHSVGAAHDYWVVSATAPFLTAIPLAVWTIRLCISPNAYATERYVAWSIMAISAACTLTFTGYILGAFVGSHEGRLGLSPLASMLMLAFTAMAIWQIRRSARAYVIALIAMTGALAVHYVLILILLILQPREPVWLIVFATLVMWQSIVIAALNRRYR